MERSKSLLIWGLLVGILLMAIKFVAWRFTNSNAILSDALESIINVAAGTFALVSFGIASLPRDRNHPYGHGKVEFLSAGLEGGLIGIAGLAIIGKAIYNLIHPQELARLDLGFGLVLLAGAVNLILGWLLLRQGKRKNSPLLQSNGKHLLSDAWSSGGLLLGLGLVWLTGLSWLDNAVAILFGGIILYTGYRVFRNSLGGILDEADTEKISQIVDLLEQNRRPSWIDLHNFRVIQYGPNLHIDAHMTFPWYFNNRQTHEQINAVERVVDQASEGGIEFFIHVDPCNARSCPLCTIADCPVREQPFRKKLSWKLENAVQTDRHFLP